MLRVGLTGGIAAGKSLASRRLTELGAIVVDADRIAREVVLPGTPGLEQVVERFGPEILTDAGHLNRDRLGQLVFTDPDARADLERITHPLIRTRTEAMVDAAPDDAIIIHDVPLLVEKNLGPDHHLTIVVHASAEERLARMVRDRGMTEKAARQRINAQATDKQRRASADVWLENNAAPAQLRHKIDKLWNDRLVPFEHNVRTGERVRRPELLTVVPPNPDWPAQGARLTARLRRIFGPEALAVEHIGSTAVPGMPAKDVIDVQVGVRDLSVLDQPEWRERISDGGFPRAEGEWWDLVRGDGRTVRARKHFHGSADPGRIVHMHVREIDSPAWRLALLFRAWFTTDAEAHLEYRALKRQLVGRGLTATEYAKEKEPYFERAAERAEAWAKRTEWRMPTPR